ncbi:hypothetical protein LIA77_03346 [Sarocladium implicatum]|nr:hypothetical protein LIA77_03346 [Sarocladium implicatum]
MSPMSRRSKDHDAHDERIDRTTEKTMACTMSTLVISPGKQSHAQTAIKAKAPHSQLAHDEDREAAREDRPRR